MVFCGTLHLRARWSGACHPADTGISIHESIHYAPYREESDDIAQCLDVDVSSFGAAAEEALANLKEAIEPYFEYRPALTVLPEISAVSVGELAIA